MEEIDQVQPLYNLCSGQSVGSKIALLVTLHKFLQFLLTLNSAGQWRISDFFVHAK